MNRGTVIKDERGKHLRWVLRFRDVNGRWRRETTGVSTRPLARRLLAERNDQVAHARLLGLHSIDALVNPAPAVTIRAFGAEYLEHCTANLSPGTVRRYAGFWRTRLLPEFGTRVLREVTPGDVQRYSDRRLREGARPSTVHQELAFLSGLFREAAKQEIVPRNPVLLVKMPRIDNTISRYLSENEEARLLAASPEPLRTAILIAIHSGLRDSELRGLTWANVDLENGHLTVRQTKAKRDRIVPLNETLRGILTALPRHLTSPYVLTNPKTGAPYDRFNNTSWKKALRRAGIERLRWHDLRHTCGSRMAQAGVSPLAIRDILGHATLQMTERYAHMRRENLREAVAALDPQMAKEQAAE